MLNIFDEPAGYCVYCDRYVYFEDAPPVDDVEIWNDLAKEHRYDCEWIKTRAHQLEN